MYPGQQPPPPAYGFDNLNFSPEYGQQSPPPPVAPLAPSAPAEQDVQDTDWNDPKNHPTIPGYNSVGDVPPPPYEEVRRQDDSQRAGLVIEQDNMVTSTITNTAINRKTRVPIPMQLLSLPNRLERLNEQQVRDALGDFVAKQNCCWSSLPVHKCSVNAIESHWIFKYKLETFAEKRHVDRMAVPYRGELITLGLGPPPSAWDVQVTQPPQEFTNKKIEMEVPFTSGVRPCQPCMGTGFRRCRWCFGTGRVRCTCVTERTVVTNNQRVIVGNQRVVGGRGIANNQRVVVGGGNTRVTCVYCAGTYFKRCMHCQGMGRTRCQQCKGQGRMRTFLKLTITWTNHVLEAKYDDSGDASAKIPVDMLKNAGGEQVLSETGKRVTPLSSFIDERIVQASKANVQKHIQSLRLERIQAQRQSVYCVPVTKVRASYRGDERSFYVVGRANAVHFEDYWCKFCGCCCACAVM